MTYMSGREPGVSRRARRHLAHVRSAIEGRLASHGERPLSSIGDGDRCVVVRLTPNAAPIAEELERKFGNVVSITVGFKPFPPSGVNFRPVLLESSGTAGWWSAMRVTCECDNALIPRGDSTTGQLVILNRGNAEVKFLAAVSVGWLCVPGTLDVVGGYSGAIAAGARAVELDAGGITSFNFIVGTASCEANDRYVVESGSYDVVVPLSIWDAGARDPDRLLVRDCFVRVTDVES
jgi:hypothetical protein